MARGGAAASVDRERQREQLVDAALRVVEEHGLGELTVRRIAEAAGTSTMSVYSRFGGRDGMLEAVYRRAFVMLGDAFRAASPPDGTGGNGNTGADPLSPSSEFDSCFFGNVFEFQSTQIVIEEMLWLDGAFLDRPGVDQKNVGQAVIIKIKDRDSIAGSLHDVLFRGF